jgi:hypothetical protein
VTIPTVSFSGMLVVIYEVVPSLLAISCFTASLTRNKSSMSKFRQLQILVTIHNNVYNTLFYMNALVVSSAIATVGGYLVIRHHSKFPSMIIGVISISTVIIYIIMLTDWTVTGKVNSLSRTVLSEWKACYSIMKDPAQRRIVHSCPYLKVMIGSAGFATRISPALVLSFCVEQTVSLLLME